MNALNIYLTTCRYVMQADLADRETWGELYRYLPFLRQALSCCICRNLIVRPIGPVHNVCQHFVCFNCRGGKMKLKPQCSWCKNHDEFQENTQLRIAVLCFKKLCEYISDSPIGADIHRQAHSPNGETNSLVSIIQEALDFEDDFKLSHSLPLPPGINTVPKTKSKKPPRQSSSSKLPSKATKKNEQILNSKEKQHWLEHTNIKDVKEDTESPESQKNVKCDVSFCSNSTENDSDLLNSSSSQSDESIEIDVIGTDKSIESKPETDHSLKRKCDAESENRLYPLSDSKESSLQTTGSQSIKGNNSHNVEPDIKRLCPGTEQREIKICKCGRGGTNSRLTCLGQRCPCYIKKLPCIGCKCTGCRNPRKVVDGDQGLKIVKMEKASDIDCVNSENVYVNV